MDFLHTRGNSELERPCEAKWWWLTLANFWHHIIIDLVNITCILGFNNQRLLHQSNIKFSPYDIIWILPRKINTLLTAVRNMVINYPKNLSLLLLHFILLLKTFLWVLLTWEHLGSLYGSSEGLADDSDYIPHFPWYS